jgi:putative DNA primase/helicase
MRLGISSERRSKRVSVARQPVRAEPASDPQWTARALAIWHEARAPQNTPVQAYFRRRGLDLPEDAAGAVIRYHRSCPFGPEHRAPAMVCLVRDAMTDAPKAIHRTALDPSGNKIKINGSDRLALGPVGGGAIKLTADENVTTCLGIGEGIETTLSLRLLPEFGCSPTWSLISAGGIENFPVLNGIECLWIAVDNDASGKGQRAANACAERWRNAGREVFLVTPNAERADLNDLVEGRRA